MLNLAPSLESPSQQAVLCLHATPQNWHGSLVCPVRVWPAQNLDFSSKWLLQDYDEEEEEGEDERERRDTVGASGTWPKKYSKRISLGKAQNFDTKKAAIW